MDDLLGYAIALLATVGTGVMIWLKGKKEGKRIKEAEQTKERLETEKRQNEISKTANDVRSNVDVASDSDVKRRLQDKYTRD